MPDVSRPEGLAGVVIVKPDVFGDDRGSFVESFRKEWLGDVPEMIQSNRARRRAGSVVGLHFHLYQADYWFLVAGRGRAVLHDLRKGSPTEGATLTVDMDDERGPGIYIPPGVAHGFSALTDLTLTYLVDRYYDPSDEHGVAWDDPAVGADWGVADPVLSGRDRDNPRRAELPADRLPVFSS